MGAREVDEIVEFIGRLDPELRGRMVGASDAEISVLEAIASVEFCASLRAWLRHIGNTESGALNPFLYDFGFSIADVQRFYTDLEKYEMKLPPRVVFLTHLRRQYELFLVQPLDPGGEPAVAHVFVDDDDLPDEERVRVVYPSFSAWLAGEVFFALFLMRQEVQFGLTVDDRRTPTREVQLREQTARIAGHLGFTRVPHSNGRSQCFERGDVGLRFGKTYDHQPFSIWVAGQDERETRLVAEVFSDHLGVQPERDEPRRDWG